MFSLLLIVGIGSGAYSGGACTDKDKEILQEAGISEFTTDIEVCSHSCLAAEVCVIDCIKERRKYSEACATCFGKFAQCARDSCQWECMSGTEDTCAACVQENCDEAFDACAGFEEAPAVWAQFGRQKKLPEAYEQVKEVFHLFRRNSESEISHLVVLIHGFYHGMSKWAVSMKDKILQWDSRPNLAVLIVDWAEGSAASWDVTASYDRAAANSRYVGASTQRFIEGLRHHDGTLAIHCIGHSLGAHACGFLGKEQIKAQHGKKIWRITGLDPAGPQFTTKLVNGTFATYAPIPGTNKDQRLDATDAHLVDVVHTDGLQWSTMENLGRTDFFVGNSINTLGVQQAGCASGDNCCHHNKAWEWFMESIELPGVFKNILKCEVNKPVMLGCKVVDGKLDFGYYYNETTPSGSFGVIVEGEKAVVEESWGEDGWWEDDDDDVVVDDDESRADDLPHYRDLKTDVCVWGKDNAQNAKRTFTLPTPTQEIILHYESGLISCGGLLHKTCKFDRWGTQRGKTYIMLVNTHAHPVEIIRFKAPRGGEGLPLGVENEDQLSFKGSFTAGEYEVWFKGDYYQARGASDNRGETCVTVRVPAPEETEAPAVIEEPEEPEAPEAPRQERGFLARTAR